MAADDDEPPASPCDLYYTASEMSLVSDELEYDAKMSFVSDWPADSDKVSEVSDGPLSGDADTKVLVTDVPSACNVIVSLPLTKSLCDKMTLIAESSLKSESGVSLISEGWAEGELEVPMSHSPLRGDIRVSKGSLEGDVRESLEPEGSLGGGARVSVSWEEAAGDKEGVVAGHVAALREMFESMTRANTPCPELANSTSPSTDLFRNATPSPDILG